MKRAAKSATTPIRATFFATPADFRDWLDRHHASERELWVGYHKKATGRPSLTWQESVDEALCYGWIDGIRKSLDDERYVIRFTPRRARSIWSNVNTRRVAVLTREGRMRPAGLAAFEARDPARAGIYAFEQTGAQLSPEMEKRFKGNRAAWKFFEAQPPGYRKIATRYVMSAKREETRAKRLENLIAESAAGQRIGLLRRPDKK